jgi:hypothetical protein
LEDTFASSVGQLIETERAFGHGNSCGPVWVDSKGLGEEVNKVSSPDLLFV